MLECWICPNNHLIAKSNVTPGGKQNYIITCLQLPLTFEAVYDEHSSNLPCYKRELEERK